MNEEIRKIIYNKSLTSDAIRVLIHLHNNQDKEKFKLVEIQDELGISRFKLLSSFNVLEEEGLIERQGKKIKMREGN